MLNYVIIQSIKIEVTPIFFRENANFEKHGCQNSVAMVTSILTYSSQRHQNVRR